MEFSGLRLGGGDESPVDRILSEINDPKRVINDGFRDLAHGLHHKIQEERKKQGLKVYTPAQAAIFLQALTNAATFHDGQTRETGETYLEGHLVPTVENLLDYAGITGAPTLAAGILHDAKEDQHVPLENLLPARQIEELLRALGGTDQEELQPEWVDTQVRNMVDGMSKATSLVDATKEEVRAATFVHLLEIARDFGPRVMIVKGAGDRLSNLSTLGVMSERTRTRTLDETERDYIPLLILFQVRLAVAEALKWCVHHRNEKLEKDFLRLVEGKQKEFAPHQEKILDVFRPKETKNGHNFITGIQDIQINPPTLAQHLYFDRMLDEPLQDLDCDRLNISPLDPLLEITILAETEEAIPPIIAHLFKSFLGRGPDKPVNYPVSRGHIFYFRDPRFGGNLKFRINSASLEARSKRGLIKPGDNALSEDLRRVFGYTIAKTKAILERSGGNVKPTIVYDIARKEFLQPQKRARAALDGKVYYHASHATYLDFARAVHADLLIGLQKVWITGSIHGDAHQQEAFPFDEFPDDTVIRIDSCLQRGTKIDPSKIAIDPGWLIFCQSQGTRDMILRYLRSPYSEFQPEIRAARERFAKAGGDQTTDSATRNIALKELGTIRNEDKKICMMSGERFLANVAAVFDLSVEDFINLMRQFCRETKQADRGKILLQAGRGSVDMLRFLAERFGNLEKWIIKVTLPNIPGAEQKFMNDASFGDLGMNIEKKHWPSEASQSPEIMVGSVTLSDHSGKLGPEDFFKILLKLKYRGYHITLQLEPHEKAALAATTAVGGE